MDASDLALSYRLRALGRVRRFPLVVTYQQFSRECEREALRIAREDVGSLFVRSTMTNAIAGPQTATPRGVR